MRFCGCCWACGYVGNALALSTYPQAGAFQRCGAAGRGSQSARFPGQAGRRLSTAKSRIGAVPHTVLGTNAGAVFHPLRISSMPGGGRTGSDGAVFSVRTVPGPGADLQPLRSRPDLLRVGMRAAGAAPRATGGRSALSGEPPWPLEPCGACQSLSGSTKECDASGFPAAAPG
jgi:hypothetical protein